MSLFERFLCTVLPHRDIEQNGQLYLRRFCLGPKIFGRRVYLHKICLSDQDRAPHDHPFDYISIILRGSYREIRYFATGNRLCESFDDTFFALDTLHRPATTVHRLEVTNPVWTLVLRGKTKRPWYFYTEQGPVLNTEYKGQP